jgi:hypothetical protein
MCGFFKMIFNPIHIISLLIAFGVFKYFQKKNVVNAILLHLMYVNSFFK